MPEDGCDPTECPNVAPRPRGRQQHLPNGPYRGMLRPVITAAMERLMDCAATRLELDTLESGAAI